MSTETKGTPLVEIAVNSVLSLHLCLTIIIIIMNE